jgi:Fe-S-cluster containining protein
MTGSGKGKVMNKTEKKKQELCIACQECCKCAAINIGYVPHANLKDLEEFYETRGFRLVPNLSVSAIQYLVVIPNARCKYLDDKRGCTIYPKRPLACKLYDGTRDPVVGNKCKWKELEDG